MEKKDFCTDMSIKQIGRTPPEVMRPEGTMEQPVIEE